jgi:ribonuclease R
MPDFRKQIIDTTRGDAYRPLRKKELARAMGIPKQMYDHFRQTLRELEREGALCRIKGGRYTATKETEIVAGQLSVTRSGNGFLACDAGGPDVYVRAMNLGTALHGDRVSVQLSGRPRRSGAPEGRVVEVLERGSSSVVGTYQTKGRGGCVIPDDPRITWELLVAEADRLGAQKGQKVVAEIGTQESARGALAGRVLEVLGNPDDPGMDVLSILKAYDLPTEFPETVDEETERTPAIIPEAEIARRVDFRDELVFTIDPEDAKDFDDAVSIKQLDNGHVLLGVHIADVSFYVPEQSALDREARARGTSVYLVDRVIPMLPERLSSEICSLRPDEDRLTMSAVMELDAKGEVVTYQVVDSVIRSGARLTYQQAQAMLDGTGEKDRDKPPASSLQPPLYGRVADALRQLDRLSKVLIERRKKRGSIDFDLPEPEVTLDELGVPIDIQRAERLSTHRLIESFMLLANVTVARHMADAEAPFLYRVHEPPDQEKLEAFAHFVRALGYSFHTKEAHSPKYLRDFLSKVAGHREEPLVHELLLRSMKRAVYTPENSGHFGLACPLYTHFTSPIRRYPDLVVHRILRETHAAKGMSSERETRWTETLPEIGAWISERERIAVEAERASVKVKQAAFMEDKIGEQFWGIISGVTKFGLFVELEKFLVEGLVHVSSLTDDYYELDEAQYALIGARTAKRLRMGDLVRIRVLRVDRHLRQVDFELVEDEKKKKAKGAPPRRKGRGGRRR